MAPVIDSENTDGTAGFLCVVRTTTLSKGEFYSSVTTPQSDSTGRTGLLLVFVQACALAQPQLSQQAPVPATACRRHSGVGLT